MRLLRYPYSHVTLQHTSFCQTRQLMATACHQEALRLSWAQANTTTLTPGLWRCYMAVTALEIKTCSPFAQGTAFGDVGPYEQLDGTVHFAVDPDHPSNAGIT